MNIRQALRNLFTGVERQRPPTVRATLDAAHSAFGTWKNVATELGISDRTLRRVRSGLISPRSRQRIVGLGGHPEVRLASMTSTAARRIQRMQTSSTRVKIKGTQGPRGYGKTDTLRYRTVSADLRPDQMMDIADAFFDGNDREAERLFEQHFADSYRRGWDMPGNWQVEDDPAQPTEFTWNI